jgi:PPOX class F420-dependent enzyme/OxyR family protein
MAFTDEEVEYLRSQRLCRIATVGPDGQPDVVPVGFELDGDYVYVGGIDPTKTRKYRNVQAGNTKVALVIDDLVSAPPGRCATCASMAPQNSSNVQASSARPPISRSRPPSPGASPSKELPSVTIAKSSSTAPCIKQRDDLRDANREEHGNHPPADPSAVGSPR